MQFTSEHIDTQQKAAELEPMVRAYLVDDLNGFETVSSLKLDPDDFVSDTMDQIHKYLPPDGAISAIRDGEDTLRGCVFLRRIRPDAGEIKRLYVDPVMRGAGAGFALMTHILYEARRMGFRDIFLDVGTYAKPAQKLYRKLGFTEIERYPEGEEDPDIIPHLIFMQMSA